ncbi:hypothetical protein P154DRAFT_533438 [Amniculicola lignicola CBS 123094]|uniref:Uncharacterized protein n=1 Tax=Amniculicola lignicola CBS 123094 TaxID=1392246 RepID=A0A6A5WJ15_9PLEO|nr:hypothetical protein P154DRAFT_533438 [Amniculicola lignicola CBS 123094]
MSDDARYLSGLFFRDTDPMTIDLRNENEGTLDITQFIRLRRHAYPPPASSASTASTSGTTIFSSERQSTKPTSAGSSSYPIHGYVRKDQPAVAYASSLSATQGSGSDTEREATQYHELFGLAGWIMDDPNVPRKLKGPAKGRRPPPRVRKHKAKKYDVVVHCKGRVNRDDYGDSSSDEEGLINVSKPVITRRTSKGLIVPAEAKFSPQRRNEVPHSQLASDDVSTESSVAPLPLPLPRTRLCLLTGLVATFVLMFGLCAYAAHHTGKQRAACFKGILFSATVLVSWCFAIIAMIRARRVIHEALLAGLFQFLVGVALVAAIHDLM